MARRLSCGPPAAEGAPAGGEARRGSEPAGHRRGVVGRRPEATGRGPGAGARTAALPAALAAAVSLCVAGFPAAARPPAAPAGPAGADTARDPFRRPPVRVLEARRSALLDSLGPGAVVVPSARRRELEGEYPQSSSFRQNNDFLYLTGLETPDSWLLLLGRPGGGRKAFLYVPERSVSGTQWTRPRPTDEELARRSGIRDVRPTEDFERMVEEGRISSYVREGTLYLPFTRQTSGRPLLRRLAHRSGVPVGDAKPALAALRFVKDSFEVELLREAADITARGIRAALERAAPGRHEYELEAALEARFHAAGAERVGFPSIVGSGPNSVILHYDRNRRRLEEGDLVVLDAGAEYSYYTADVTRTFPADGRFSDRQRRLYRLVLGALEAGLEEVRPGSSLRDVDRAVRRHLGRNSDGLCGEASCDRHFVHGVGHWLGMDVHDVGDYSRTFRPGTVLTVEPGIYLTEEDLGIRIEEDVLVTRDGHEVLTSELPREPGRIEELMRDAGG